MIRAWLVDDELLALKRLRRMLEETGEVQVVGSSSDPAQAVEELAAESVDALFLDIEMPGMNGFEFLRKLDSAPAVVFTTAYDQYAVKAFEINGVDYLLKPVSPEALSRAVARLKQRTPAANRPLGDDGFGVMLERLAQAFGEGRRSYPMRIASKIGDRVQFIELTRVTHFFAEDKVTWAATPGKNFIVDETIAQLEARLDPAQFHRIHRGCLVNLSAVAEVASWFAGKMVARLNDPAKTELPVARDRVKTLRERLGF
jgi:two-component system LytT family response regulator